MKKYGRNDPCHCGSGKKYKQCCLLLEKDPASNEQSGMTSAPLHIPNAIKLALGHHQAGRLPEAETLCRQILQADPNHSDALHLLGLLAQRAGRGEMAIELISHAIRVNPRNPAYYVNLGSLYNSLTRPSEAVLAYRKALALKPDFAEAHYNLGLAFQSQGKPDEAVACYRRALMHKSDFVEAHNLLGNALKTQGKLDDAKTCYLKALTLRPNFAEAQYNLGAVFMEQGKPDEALDRYRQAVLLKADFAEAHNNLGAILKEQGKLDDALTCYRQAVLFKPNFADVHNNLGAILKEQGKLDEARSCYEKALAIKPDYAEALNNLGSTLKELGKLDEAIACFEKALAIKKDFAGALINYGALLMSQGKRAEAIAIAEAATRLKEQAAFPHFSHGVLLAHCGLKEEASKFFELCLTRDPEDSQGALLLLASLGYAPIPERASEAYLCKLYNARAHFWDQTVDNANPYCAPNLVAAAFRKIINPSAGADVLDAGCGTGLVGALIHDQTRRMDGIDLSQAMLEKAGSKRIYHALYQSDLISFMATRPENYDVVTCAATLIHFGDLRSAFEAAATTLRDNGIFIFTLFPNDDDINGKDVAVASFEGLAQGGCYTHSNNYVVRMAEATNFMIESLERGIHEYSEGKPRIGLIVALRRRSRINQDAMGN